MGEIGNWISEHRLLSAAGVVLAISMMQPTHATATSEQSWIQGCNPFDAATDCIWLVAIDITEYGDTGTPVVASIPDTQASEPPADTKTPPTKVDTSKVRDDQAELVRVGRERLSGIRYGLGGHQGAEAFYKGCPDQPDKQQQCIQARRKLDCSGFLNLALYEVYGIDKRHTVASLRNDKDFKRVPKDKWRKGTILLHGTQHAELYDKKHKNGENWAWTVGASRPGELSGGGKQWSYDTGLEYVGPDKNGVGVTDGFRTVEK